MMKIVVTGASGFIGRYILPMLQANGFEVHAISRTLSAKGNKPFDGVFWHNCNLMDLPAVGELLAEIQPSHLLHLAWYTEHGKFWSASENLDWVAVSLGLLSHFAMCGGERVVMAGSCAEYDWPVGCCNENSTPCKPSSLYGVTKHALFNIADKYCSLNNLSFAWGRIFFLYGPGEFSGRFVPSVIDGLLRGEKVACSDGYQICDFMHVSDVASAFTRLVDSNVEGAINIASGERVTLRDVGQLLEKIIEGTGCVNFGGLSDRSDDPMEIVADVSRLKSELCWSRTMALSEGLGQMVTWSQQEGCFYD